MLVPIETEREAQDGLSFNSLAVFRFEVPTNPVIPPTLGPSCFWRYNEVSRFATKYILQYALTGKKTQGDEQRDAYAMSNTEILMQLFVSQHSFFSERSQ